MEMRKKRTIILNAFLIILLLTQLIQIQGEVFSKNREKLTLVGWGIPKKDLDHFFKNAAEVGFKVLITKWNENNSFLQKVVNIASKYNIKIFAAISPVGWGIEKEEWKKLYSNKKIPWQVMNKEEKAAEIFIKSGKNRYLIPYQWGGEPLLTHEVLTSKILCFSHPEVIRFLESIINRVLQVKGIEGIAFDGFGYQNYYRCYCDECCRKFRKYRKQHPDLSEKEAELHFFRELLVDTINHLAEYARGKRPEIKISIHIWPVFQPDPLYGNRLNVDYCGQTAAWYTLWPYQKIAKYSKIIVNDAKKYYPHAEGVGMIGYFYLPGKFPIKTPHRVEMELKTMIENGIKRIQVCSAIHVIKNKDISSIFKKYFYSK